MVNYYPVFLDIRRMPCLVVGGGSVAERKVELLLECGAAVTVVSPRCTDRLRQLACQERLSLVERSYEHKDLRSAGLVIAATDSHATNAEIAQQARTRGLMVNAVDDPDLCTFLAPAIVRRGDLTVAISTGGRSPALARYAREQIEQLFPPGYEQVIDQMSHLRQRLRSAVPAGQARERVWRALMADGLVELLRAGAWDEVERQVGRALAEMTKATPTADRDND